MAGNAQLGAAERPWCRGPESGRAVEEGTPAAEGAVKRQVVSRIEPTARGQTLGEPRDRDAREVFPDRVGEVVGSRLAFNIGAGGEDDFAHGAAAQALQQGGNAEIVRADVVERAEPAVEGVIMAFESTSAFKGKDIGGLLDDADLSRIAGRIIAEDAACGEAGEEAAGRAQLDAGTGRSEGTGEVGGGRLGGAEQPEGDAFGTARADAGKPLEVGDEVPEFLWIVDFGHGRRGSFRDGLPWRRGTAKEAEEGEGGVRASVDERLAGAGGPALLEPADDAASRWDWSVASETK